MDNIKVSIAIVFYKQSMSQIISIIKNLILLRDSTDFGYSFYIINNDIDDKISATILNIQTDSDFFVINSSENGGFSKGNNLVLRVIESDIHIVMNPDIKIFDFLDFSKMIEYLMNHSEIGLISPKIISDNGSLQRLNRKKPTVFDLLIRFLGPNWFSKRQKSFVKYSDGYDSTQPIENASGSFLVFKTKVFKEINGFDERYFMYMEDTDITNKVNEISSAIFYPYFKVIHGWARQNHSFKGFFRMGISMIKYFNKWGWRFF